MTATVTGRGFTHGARTQALQLRTFKALPTLAERFPRVREMRIHWWIDHSHTSHASGEDRTWRFVPTSRAHLSIECVRGDCLDGGCDLSPIVANMIEVGDRFLKGRLVCAGWRRGRDQRLEACERAICYEIEIDWIDG